MAKQRPPAESSAVQPTTPAEPSAGLVVAVSPRNVPFVGASNKVLDMVHAKHGVAQVGDWQVEEFAANGWQMKV